LFAIFALIIVLPLAMLAWLGARAVREERDALSRRFAALVEERLRDVDMHIARLVAARERDILELGLSSTGPPEQRRELAAELPTIAQFFVLNGGGDLVYPLERGPLTKSEQAFLRRTEGIWDNHDILFSSTESAPPTPPPSQSKGFSKGGRQMVQMQQSLRVPSLSHGWHPWFWGNGLNLLFWIKEPSGRVVGAELDSVRFVADVIGALPETDPFDMSGTLQRVTLMDSTGDNIYTWGRYEPGSEEEPLASIRLSPPLGAWALEYYGPRDPLLAGEGMEARLGFVSLLGGLAAFGLAMTGLAVYFYRESSRDLREAAQRVTFVNQVSHELKTPLTNIRMYAEMLDGTLDEASEGEESKPRRYLNVIVSESQRLSRLIGNILTFSRKHRKALSLHAKTGNIDEVLGEVVRRFGPALQTKAIAASFEGGIDGESEFDQDVVEQIVGNLLSNVEKYAAGGDRVEVSSRREGDEVTVRVSDNGPGIRERDRERVFRPFYRVSNNLTDGVAGTGIGLSIARDLARLHGGDLVLKGSEQGACFLAILRAPRCGE
jgi:signal transduction histidine kinase